MSRRVAQHGRATSVGAEALTAGNSATEGLSYGNRTEPVVAIDRAAVELGGRTIWKDVSLSVSPGEFIAILGPNGAGKSTLIKAILGLVPLSHGSVTLDGSDPRHGRQAVGYVPQRRSFSRDVHVRGRDLVQLGLDGARWGFGIPFADHLPNWGRRARNGRDRVQRVIEMVRAGDLADRPIGDLSGGEKQRMLIAQALVTNPRLLLLDEPLDSLDLANQHEVSGVIRQISQETGAAVLLVAHDVNPLLRYVDRLVYLAKGRMAVGKPDEIITTESLSRLYGAPLEVLRTRDGRLVVVGQPEGVPCADYHGDDQLPDGY